MALVRVGNGCATERHIEVAQNAGAIGCVIYAGPFTLCQYLDQHSNSYDLKIPAMCISNNGEDIEIFDDIVNESLEDINKIVTVKFTSNGSPISKLNQGGLIFMQVFYLSLFSLLIILTCYKMISFLINHPFFTFRIYILILLIIGK